MIIGFTGTRQGLSHKQKVKLAEILYIKHRAGADFHHGNCIGADIQAAVIARQLKYYIIAHPPENPQYEGQFTSDETRERLPYLARNRTIVLESDELIACPKESKEILRSGTWATVRYARIRDKTINIITP